MNTAIVSIVTFALGLFFGHRLALGRDKRKEFNEAAEPIRDWLLREEERPYPYAHFPSTLELDTFAYCLKPMTRKRFNAAMDAYRRELERSGSTAYEGMVYEDPESARQAVRRLMPFTRRR